MKKSDIHIGQLIKETLKNDGRTITWLANEIGRSRSDMHHIFDRCSLDTNLLFAISSALKTDFFKYYTQELGCQK